MQHPKILFASSEVTPVAKVGGLGDVAAALPKALALHGADVEVILPLYDIVDRTLYDIQPTGIELNVRFGNVSERVAIYRTTIPESSVPLVLLENSRFFGGGGVYGTKTSIAGTFQEIKRFAFFSFAIAEYIASCSKRPQIVHCNDWHTSLVASALKVRGISNIRSLLTIHTMGNQGPWSEQELREFVGPNVDLTDDNDMDGIVRLLVHGIKTADWITTVSPTYAQEILTSEYGEGVHPFLQQKRSRLSGILNGIDVAVFNPANDPNIPRNYTLESISEKQINKHALQRELGLPETDAILFGLISRLTTKQKGIDLALDALPILSHRNAQFVLLGSGESPLERRARELDKQYPNVAARLEFDAALAQRIYAGCDAFMMPSRFEPCGLGQMIAMRYGTLPVVRDTGGLHDTVPDYTSEDGRGFVFRKPTASAFVEQMNACMDVYEHDHARWMELVRNAMTADFSWEASALEYLHLYEQVMVG